MSSVVSPPESAWRQRALPWALPLLLLAAWEIASTSGWLSTRVLPETLDDTWKRISAGFVDAGGG